MGIHGLPPASHGHIAPIGPSDEDLKNQYQNLKQEFLSIWGAYSHNPSSANEQMLAHFLQKQLLPFFENNKAQMKEICAQNGWDKSGSFGYDSNIEGIMNNIHTMPMPPNPFQLNMLNEALTTIWTMLETKN